MSTQPSLLLGSRLGPILYEPRLNEADEGVNTVVLDAKSHRLAPAGVGGQCIFRALYFAVRYEQQQSILVSAWVDDVLVVDQYNLIMPARAALSSASVQVPLSVPVLYLGVERARTRPQGTWIQVQVQSPAQTLLAIDGVDVEWEATQRRF